jgi:hypothetical protein
LNLRPSFFARKIPFLRIANIEDFNKAAIPIKRTFFVPGCSYFIFTPVYKITFYGHLATAIGIPVFKEKGPQFPQQQMDEIHAWN